MKKEGAVKESLGIKLFTATIGVAAFAFFIMPFFAPDGASVFYLFGGLLLLLFLCLYPSFTHIDWSEKGLQRKYPLPTGHIKWDEIVATGHSRYRGSWVEDCDGQRFRWSDNLPNAYDLFERTKIATENNGGLIDIDEATLSGQKNIRLAEELFQGVAAELELDIAIDEDVPVEVSMTLPKQGGLKFEIWLCLQNIDELWFSVDDVFTTSRFPCQEVIGDFRDDLVGFIKGDLRIRVISHAKTGKVRSSFLERKDAGEWQVVSTYGRGIRLRLFVETTEKIIQNL